MLSHQGVEMFEKIRRIGDMVLLEEMCTCGYALRFQSPYQAKDNFPCLLTEGQAVNFSAPSPTCLPTCLYVLHYDDIRL